MKSIDWLSSKIQAFHWKILFFLIAIIVSLIESNERTDFLIYQMASKDIVHYSNPYSHPYIDGYYYYYSILFACLIYPFTFLNTYWSTFLWLMLNSFFLYSIINKTAEFLNISHYSIKTQFLFYFLFMIFNIRTIRENYHSAQVTILLLYFMLLSLNYLIQHKHLLSSIFLAIAINIKLLGLPLLVYYLYKGYWKIFVYTILWIILFFLLPLLGMSKPFYTDCMIQWWQLINPTKQQHIFDVDERSFHSISTLLSTLFLKNPPAIYALSIRRYIVDLHPETLKIIIQFVRFLLILSVLKIIKSLPFQSPNSKINKYKIFYESTYIMALVPLVFPHQQHYAYLFQIPAIATLLHYALTTTKHSKKFYVILSIIFLCFNLKIILGLFNEYYDHFKVLTYGGILVLILLFKLSNQLNLKNE